MCSSLWYRPELIFVGSLTKLSMRCAFVGCSSEHFTHIPEIIMARGTRWAHTLHRTCGNHSQEKGMCRMWIFREEYCISERVKYKEVCPYIWINLFTRLRGQISREEKDKKLYAIQVTISDPFLIDIKHWMIIGQIIQW